MPSKKKPTPKKKPLTITELRRENKQLKKLLTDKITEVDELVALLKSQANSDVADAPQQAPQELPSSPYYPPQPYYPYPPYPYPYYPPQPGTGQPPGSANPPAYPPPQPQGYPVPGQPPGGGPAAPPPQPQRKNMELVEVKDEKGNIISREMVPVNNPHEIDPETGELAKPVSRVNPNEVHGLVGPKPVGPCQYCGKMIDDPIHTPWKANAQ